MPSQPDDEVKAKLSEATKASWSDKSGVRRVLPDERQTFAGRVAALTEALTADLGGDPGKLKQTERSLIALAATLTARAEMLQAALLRGEPVDDDTIVRVNNSAARMLDKLGIKIRKQAGAQADAKPPWVTGWDVEQGAKQ
jgi:hypothetical protein